MSISAVQWCFVVIIIMTQYSVLCTPTKTVYDDFLYAGTRYRFYLEPSGHKCFWNGKAPFCFLSSGCPTRTTTVEINKTGDGAFCWIGSKYYCCLERPP